jgi:hypothetical protein
VLLYQALDIPIIFVKNLEVIHKISEYVTFVQNQESQMCEFEKKKMTLSNQYFKTF